MIAYPIHGERVIIIEDNTMLNSANLFSYTLTEAMYSIYQGDYSEGQELVIAACSLDKGTFVARYNHTRIRRTILKLRTIRRCTKDCSIKKLLTEVIVTLRHTMIEIS